LTSGYADDPVMTDPVAYGFAASLCKPFAMSDLSELFEKHVVGHEPSRSGVSPPQPSTS